MLVVALAAAAPFLWRTEVPAGLELRELDANEVFGAADVERAERYERFFRVLWALSTASAVVTLLLLARWARRRAPEIGLPPAGTAGVVAVVTFAALWAVELPFAAAAHWWRRRYDVARGSWLEWLVEPWLTYAVESIFFVVFVMLVVWLAGRFRRDWWLAVVPVWIAVGVTLLVVLLALTPTYTDPLRDVGLRRDADALAREIGAEGTPVDVEERSDLTATANAYAYGLGPIRRVVLWDTLLDGSYTDGEVRVILAHELAHVGRDHVLKGVMWFVLISAPLWFLIARLVDRRGGMRDPANVPFAVLVAGVLTLVFAPVENLLSRRYEAEADWVALRATEDPGSARELFRQLQHTSLSDPDPPAWAYVLFRSHPSLLERVAMADAFRSRAEGSRAGP